MTHEHWTESSQSAIECSHVWDLDQNENAIIGYRCARCRVFREVDDVRAFQSNLTPEITTAELWAFIHSIETGGVILYPQRYPSRAYAERVEFHASNGWRVVVFNDCGTWDYFDRFESDDGRVVTLTTMPEAVQAYRPTRRVAVARYRFGEIVPDQRIRAI